MNTSWKKEELFPCPSFMQDDPDNVEMETILEKRQRSSRCLSIGTTVLSKIPLAIYLAQEQDHFPSMVLYLHKAFDVISRFCEVYLRIEKKDMSNSDVDYEMSNTQISR